jgi:hypothetical protein
MFNFIDGVIQALAKKKTQGKDDFFFTMKLARQKLLKYYTEVTPTTGEHPISAHIFDSLEKLRLCRVWGKGMDINPNDKKSYTV